MMTIPKELERFNLQHAKPPVKRRLVMTSEGGPAVGKTDLFYRTAPRPALVIQLDMNDEGIREKHVKNDIVFKDIIVPPFVGDHTEAIRQTDMEIFAEMRDLYRISVLKGYFRSVMIDEGAAMYMLCRRAFLLGLGFGESSQTAYAAVNSAMDRFYTLAKQNRINLYVPHRQKDERENTTTSSGAKTSTQTGKKIYDGWKSALYTSQCHLIMDKDPGFNPLACAECGMEKKKGPKSSGCTCDKFHKPDSLSKFTATIAKCTARTSIEGTVLRGEDISWPVIGQLVFNHSDEEDWL